MRKQNRDPEIMKSRNLTYLKFKTLIIKMLDELMESVEEFSENFNKEIKNIKMEMEIIKGNQSEMKNTEVRSILNGINRVNKEENQVTYIEDGKAKNT